MLDRSLSPLDFHKPAQQLHDQVRGLIPWPCAVMTLDGKPVKVYRTAVGGDTAAAPGRRSASTSAESRRSLCRGSRMQAAMPYTGW